MVFKRFFLIYLTGFLLLAVSGISGSIPTIMIDPQGHFGKVSKVIFAHNGEEIITIAQDKTIRVWNVFTGEIKSNIQSEIGEGPEGMFYAGDLSPTANLLAVAGYPVNSQEKNYLIFVDLDKNKQVSTGRGHSNVINCVAFSHDGKYLASGSDDGTIIIWEVNTNGESTAVATIPVGMPVYSLDFDPSQYKLIVGTTDRNILLYSLDGIDRGMTKFRSTELKKHNAPIRALTYSPEGNYIASSGEDNRIVLWNSAGEMIKEMNGMSQVVNTLTFSADGKFLVALNDIDGMGISYSVPSFTKLTDFYKHDNTVFSASFSPRSDDGRYLVASAGGTNNDIYIWNPINGSVINQLSGSGRVIWDVSFGEDMELFISKTFRGLDAPRKFDFRFDFKSFSQKKLTPSDSYQPRDEVGGAVLTDNYTLRLPKGGAVLNDPNEDGRILSFIRIPNNRFLVGSDFSLKLYDLEGLLLKELVGHNGGVRSLSVSKDGMYAVSGSEDQTIKLWKINEPGDFPSLWEVYDSEDWHEYFEYIGLEAEAKKRERRAWQLVIDQMIAAKDKNYRDLDNAFNTIGETVFPFATLFSSDDNEWIVWTYRGYFNCSSAGSKYFGWHVNKGIDELADFFTAEQYFEILYRPAVVTESIQTGQRVEDILLEKGERIFDLTKLNRPSAAFFLPPSLQDVSDDQLLKTEGKYATAAKNVQLNTEIFDGGGGVKEINIFQNGKLVLIDDDIQSVRDEYIKKSYEIPLVNGINQFRIVAYNYQRIESKPDIIYVEYTGDIIATSDLYLFSIGINQYKNPKYSLNYAKGDAQAFVSKLEAHSGKMFRNIHHFEVYDTEGTKENILRKFHQIQQQAQPEDVFVFYYAGHGSLDELSEDKTYYLVPTDVTQLYGNAEMLSDKAISSLELRVELSNIKSQKQLILLDACHSGSAVSTLSTRGGANEEKAIFQLARSAGVVLIAATGTNQLATEFDQLKHGVFTYSLLEALGGRADGGSMDRKITVNELRAYMEDRVPELSEMYGGGAQYPTGFSQGQDFPISLID